MSVLAEHSRTLLSSDSAPGELLNAVQELHREFARVTEVHDLSGNPDDSKATVVQGGTAISPQDAARCILDFARTTCYIRGLAGAIDEAQRRFPGTRVEVLYAGCGPWAPLVLPLCAALDPAKVGFTLLDIHARSITAVRQLIDHFGLDEFIIDCQVADATTVRLERAPQVIVTETMQRGLAKEPQLAVSANLVPQLAENGLFLPERIRVDVCVADVQAEFAVTPASEIVDGGVRERFAMGTLLDLTPATAGPIMARARDGSLPPVSLEVPELPVDGEFHGMLLTEVTVFGDQVIGDYDSGITYPVVLSDLGALRSGEQIEFTYRLGTSPGFDAAKHTPPVIREVGPADQLSVLALNLESEHWLSPMNGQRLKELVSFDGYHRVVELDGQVVAFLIAIGNGADYDSPNYQWFNRDRSDFIYVDRIVVSEQHRGRRLASALYDDLFAFARESDVHEVGCEFNIEPPNAASRAFHVSYGFEEVGTREMADRTVSMQIARLRAR